MDNTIRAISVAIGELCTDIASDGSAEDNHKRAEAVLALAFARRILLGDEKIPDTEDAGAEREPENGEPVGESKIIPRPGERFTCNGTTFVALGEEQGGLLAIADKPIAITSFDEQNCNDWRMSSLRKYLNGDYLEKLGKEHLLPFTSDLTSDDGMKDYDTSEDYVFLLSVNLYRKYYSLIPDFYRWWWTVTPADHEQRAEYVRVVAVDGTLGYNDAFKAGAVVPACLFDYKFFLRWQHDEHDQH